MRALESFESARPGEITYGVVARFFEHTKLLSSRELHRYLFGYPTTELASRIQGGLGEMYRRMPGAWESPKTLVDRHTIYPFFRVFEKSAAEARRIESLLIKSSSSPGQRLRRLFELFPGAVWEQRFLPRFCIACVLEDLRGGRQPTWYRDHQIPGVNWCARHGKYLGDDCFVCGDKLFRHSYELPPMHRKCAHELPEFTLQRVRPKARLPARNRYGLKPSDRQDRTELRLSVFAVDLLGKNLEPIRPESWVSALQIGVKNNGLAATIRAINNAQFINDKRMCAILCGAETSMARALWKGKPDPELFAEISIRGRLQLTSAVFKSIDKFLLVLSSLPK